MHCITLDQNLFRKKTLLHITSVTNLAMDVYKDQYQCRLIVLYFGNVFKFLYGLCLIDIASTRNVLLNLLLNRIGINATGLQRVPLRRLELSRGHGFRFRCCGGLQQISF